MAIRAAKLPTPDDKAVFSDLADDEIERKVVPSGAGGDSRLHTNDRSIPRSIQAYSKNPRRLLEIAINVVHV